MNIARMSISTVALATLIITVLSSVSGCAALSGSDGGAKRAGVAHGGDPLGQVFAKESARDVLNDGYSALYSQLNTISKIDRIFYVKIESDDVQQVVDHLTDYSGQLATRLNQLSTQFPAMAIHRTTTPPIIDAVHSAQRDGTLKRFAPVVGESGTAFERGLLIRLLGVADQERYLTQVLAKKEPNPALSKVMANASDRFASHFDEINTLLKKRFYRQ